MTKQEQATTTTKATTTNINIYLKGQNENFSHRQVGT